VNAAELEARILQPSGHAQVRTNGFIVFVPKYGIEGPVYVAEKGAAADASWTMDEEKQLVTSPDSQTRCVVPSCAAWFASPCPACVPCNT
jgi:S1 domain